MLKMQDCDFLKKNTNSHKEEKHNNMNWNKPVSVSQSNDTV